MSLLALLLLLLDPQRDEVVLLPERKPGVERRIALEELRFPFHIKGEVAEAVGVIRGKIRDWRSPQDTASAAFSNLVVIGHVDGGERRTAPRVHLNLKEVSAPTALGYAGDLSGMRVEWQEHATVFSPLTEMTGDLLTQTFRVGHGLGFRLIESDHGLQTFFEARGITFPRGSGIFYNERTGMLISRNVEVNLELIRCLMDTLNGADQDELPPRLLGVGLRARFGVKGDPAAELVERLADVEIAKIDMKKMLVTEAFQVMLEALPGTTVEIHLADQLPEEPWPVTLDLRHIPLPAALGYAARQARVAYTPTDQGILLHAQGQEPVILYQQIFTVPLPLWEELTRPLVISDDPFGSDEVIPSPENIQELFAQRGISFPEGASAIYDANSFAFTHTNTAKNLDLGEGYLESCDLDRRYASVWVDRESDAKPE